MVYAGIIHYSSIDGYHPSNVLFIKCATTKSPVQLNLLGYLLFYKTNDGPRELILPQLRLVLGHSFIGALVVQTPARSSRSSSSPIATCACSDSACSLVSSSNAHHIRTSRSADLWTIDGYCVLCRVEVLMTKIRVLSTNRVEKTKSYLVHSIQWRNGISQQFYWLEVRVWTE